jgi:hypothetical protein
MLLLWIRGVQDSDPVTLPLVVFLFFIFGLWGRATMKCGTSKDVFIAFSGLTLE